MALKARIDWIEIPVTDIDRAAKFYGKLFETELEVQEDMPGIRSAFLPMGSRNGSSPIAVLMEGRSLVPSGYQGCRLYFQAEPSMEAFLTRVEEAGGAVEVPPLALGSLEEKVCLAMFFDTEGNLLGAQGKE